MIFQYYPNTDTYYIPDKEIYVKRWMFIYADPSYLASMLGLDNITIEERDRLFLRLAQEP